MREVTQFHRLRNDRIKLFYVISCLLFAYLACGVFYRQIVQRKYFQQRESRQSVRRIVIPGMRGNIYDRNGVLLAGHVRKYVLNLHVQELESEFQREYLRRINHFRDNGIKFNARDVKKRARESIVHEYVDQVNKITGRELSVSSKALERHLCRKFLLPMKLVSDISQEEYEKLITMLPCDSPLQVSVEEQRYYPYGELACHVLGYVVLAECKHDADDLDGDVRTFLEKRQVGKTGVELAKDDVLRGEPGYEIWRVDPAGHVRELIKSREPKHGTSVMLSIDKDIQIIAEEVLGDHRGCSVVMNVNTGEVLAMASKPSYDNNLLIPRILNDVYNDITEKGAWVNLVTQGKFALGSVFKLVSSIAFLKSGEVLPTDSVLCDGVTIVGGRKFRCKNHPLGMDISFGEAIARSCNTFFYENSQKVRKERIIREAINLGLSEKTGIELPYEVSGFVPTESWKRDRGLGVWTAGDTVNLSIGQGYLLVTPMEICCMTAAIAKNVARIHPTIFFNGYLGKVISEGSLGLSYDHYRFLVDSMVDVVERRSGHRAYMDNIKIGGKTGTAQFFENGEKRNLAWFTCFGPVDSPEVAVTVMVQERSKNDSYWGGVNAAPLAKKILQQYFKQK